MVGVDMKGNLLNIKLLKGLVKFISIMATRSYMVLDVSRNNIFSDILK